MCSEREARERAKLQMARHLIYRQQLVVHIEYTSKKLEKQRLEDSSTALESFPLDSNLKDVEVQCTAPDTRKKLEKLDLSSAEVLNEMIPPPAVPEVVHAPDPLPITPTLFLPGPSGEVRDFIIGMGKGCVVHNLIYVESCNRPYPFYFYKAFLAMHFLLLLQQTQIGSRGKISSKNFTGC